MMYIAIDFDGTIVEHEYPDVGEEVPFAITTIQDLMEAGHKIILHTMRSGKELAEAVEFLKLRKIELFGVNQNPTQRSWTTSPKSYAHYYIDDAAIGCPIKRVQGKRPFVDWQEIREILKEKEVLE